MDTLAAIRARAVASLIPLPRSIHLQLISNSSLSRGISSFSFALRLRNFILTRGGMAKSTSRYAVPHLHGALDALRCCCTCNERGHQHTVTRRFGRDGVHLRNVRVNVRLQSKSSLRRKAPSHFERRDLITHLFEDRQGIADLLSEGIKFGHDPAGSIGKVWQGKVRHRRQ